jgi:hypothetical protein
MKLLPGSVHLARWLAKHGIPLALVTRNSKESVKVLHEEHWLPLGLPAFEPAISRDDDYPAKPNPLALVAIAEKWQVRNASELLMVGDSLKYDVGFGKQAGAQTALLTGSPHSTDHEKDEELDLRPDFKSHDLALLAHELYSAFDFEASGSPVAGNLKKYPTPRPSSESCIAASQGDVESLKAILKSNANNVQVLNEPDSSSENTPLIWATENGHLETVRMLVDSGVDLDTRGFLGATAISRACRSGHCDILSLLLERGGDPNICNDKMQYPMHFAAFKKKKDAVTLLLKYNADTFVLDRKGRTPAEDTSDENIRTLILQSR